MVTVGAGASGVGEDTVADITLAVMLGEPAELGVASGGAAGAEAVGVALAGSELAVGSGTVVVDAGSLFVATLVPGCVEPKLTVIELGGLAAGAGEVGVVFTARSEYIFTAGALAWAAGTLPDPGAPMPGNTVPCCRLPTLGCAAEGAADADVVCATAGFSGKLIGGNLGGTGIGACAVTGSLAAGCGLRRNTPTRGAEAAGCAPLCFATAVPSAGCTRNVMVLPS